MAIELLKQRTRENGAAGNYFVPVTTCWRNNDLYKTSQKMDWEIVLDLEGQNWMPNYDQLN